MSAVLAVHSLARIRFNVASRASVGCTHNYSRRFCTALHHQGELQCCRSGQTAIPRIAILPHTATAAPAVLPPPTGGGGRTGRGQLEEEGSSGGCKNCHSLSLSLSFCFTFLDRCHSKRPFPPDQIRGASVRSAHRRRNRSNDYSRVRAPWHLRG